MKMVLTNSKTTGNLLVTKRQALNGTSNFFSGNSELRESATQQPVEEKSTRAPAR